MTTARTDPVLQWCANHRCTYHHTILDLQLEHPSAESLSGKVCPTIRPTPHILLVVPAANAAPRILLNTEGYSLDVESVLYAMVRQYGEAPQPMGNQYRCEKCGRVSLWLKDLLQCPHCGRWVCEGDWDKNVGSCTLCSTGLTGKFAEAEKLKVETEELKKQLEAKNEELAKIKGRTPPALTQGKPIAGPRVYISYALGSEVEKVVEGKVKRLLETLGMSVVTSKKDPNVAQDLSAAVKTSDIVVAVLTKDIRREHDGEVTWSPTHYVVEDVKAAAGGKVVLAAEQGVEYPTEPIQSTSAFEFRKDDPAELVVALTSTLVRLGMARGP